MIELIMKMFFKHCILITFVCLSFFAANGQKDSLVMNNGDIMVGEIKSMDKGILFIETPYSDKDFNVKWIEIKEVYSTTRFLVTLQDGRRINTTLHTNATGDIVLQLEDGLTTTTSRDE